MSMLLLAGAGLFARSLYNLTARESRLRRRQPAGVLPRSVAERLHAAIASTSLFQQLQEELGAVPGVARVSMSEIGVLTGNDWSMTVKVDGYQAKEDEDMNPSVDGVGTALLLDDGHSARRRARVHRAGRGRRPESRDHQRDDGPLLLRRHATRSAAGSDSGATPRPTSRSWAS